MTTTEPTNPYAPPQATLDVDPRIGLPPNPEAAVAGRYDFTVGEVMDEAWQHVKLSEDFLRTNGGNSMTTTARIAFAACIVVSLGCGKDHTPPKAQVYCHDLIQEGCVRAFDCVPPANRTASFLVTYGASVELCQAAPDKCAMYPAACPNFDPAAAMTCLDEFTTSDCAQILFIDANGDPTIGLPGSCGAVCPQSSP